MKRTSFGSLKRLFACLSVPREVVSCLLPGSLDLSFQKFALGHVHITRKDTAGESKGRGSHPPLQRDGEISPAVSGRTENRSHSAPTFERAQNDQKFVFKKYLFRASDSWLTEPALPLSEAAEALVREGLSSF